MNDTLNITKNHSAGKQKLFLSGRLDAGNAVYLDDILNREVRNGNYDIILNMAGVQYISSPGLRVLISHKKNSQRIGGSFILEDLQKIVDDVLVMTGLKHLLTDIGNNRNEILATDAEEKEVNDCLFTIKYIQAEPMKLQINGSPLLLGSSVFLPSDSKRIIFSSGHYGLGIGAIGNNFDDCRNRFGEFIGIEDAVMYRPSEGKNIPDYMVKTGALSPEINILYSLCASGTFSNKIKFKPKDPSVPVKISDLVSGISRISGYSQFVFLMLAESGGIIGASLNESPVNDQKIFEFPKIRENINFTIEPAYPKALTVSLGFFSTDPDDKLKPFLRPVSTSLSGYAHTHTAVFPYQVLSVHEKSAGKLLLQLLETSVINDLFHLIHDDRKLEGAGESMFTQGMIWFGKFN